MAALEAGRALLQACKQGSLAEVKANTARILAIPPVQDTNPAIVMAMGEAAYTGRVSVLRHLMADLPKSRWQGSVGPWSPLIMPPVDRIPEEWRVTIMPDYVVYRAAAGGIPDVMQALFDAGLTVDHEVERIGAPLAIATGCNQVTLARFLLAKGANPNKESAFPPVSLLRQAALLPSLVLVQLLLDHGAAVEKSMALQGAAQTGSIEIASCFLDLGADVNEIFRWNMIDGDKDVIGSALHVAVQHKQEAMVEFLLRRGAKQDLLDGVAVAVTIVSVSARATAIPARGVNPQFSPLALCIQKLHPGFPKDGSNPTSQEMSDCVEQTLPKARRAEAFEDDVLLYEPNKTDTVKPRNIVDQVQVLGKQLYLREKALCVGDEVHDNFVWVEDIVSSAKNVCGELKDKIEQHGLRENGGVGTVLKLLTNGHDKQGHQLKDNRHLAANYMLNILPTTRHGIHNIKQLASGIYDLCNDGIERIATKGDGCTADLSYYRPSKAKTYHGVGAIGGVIGMYLGQDTVHVADLALDFFNDS
ncbi:hypothetical protein NX059_012160 [Plenodomus lindquistii]|nr:hypothetical protein NX059_012160 [Plenodomus lindquistii]